MRRGGANFYYPGFFQFRQIIRVRLRAFHMQHQKPFQGTLVVHQVFWVLVFVYLPLITYSAIVSPSEIVKLWIQFYPTDMKAAAALTTKVFRKGQNEPQWIEAQKNSLGDSKFHYLGAKVISESIEGEDAVVVIQANFSSVIGEQIEEEVYHLKMQPEGGWLINAVEIKEDPVLGHDS